MTPLKHGASMTTIPDLLHDHYSNLYQQCDNDDERGLLNRFYQQLTPTNLSQVKLFLSLRTQQRVIPDRKYRVDFAAIVDGVKYAIEYEGGCYSRGRASIGYRSIGGYKSHVGKYNLLAAHGWLVFRFQNDTAQLKQVWAVLGLDG